MIFNFCTSLEKVEFSEDSQLNSIKESTFSDNSIKIIAIPRNVKQIGENATAIENVWQIDQFAFSDCKNIKLFEIIRH